MNVLVLGRLSREWRHVESRLKACGNLHARHIAYPSGVPAGYELYVVWADFCNHGVVEAAKSSGGRTVIHRGGKSSLARRIIEEAGQ